MNKFTPHTNHYNKMGINKINWQEGLKLSEWQKSRQSVEGVGNEDVTRIGGSDISVIMGTNKWKCKQRLFHHLTGKHHSFFMTPKTIAGHKNEPLIADYFMAYDPLDEQQFFFNVTDGIQLRKIKKADYFLLNSKYPNFFASIDYVPDGEVFSPLTGELYPEDMPIEMKTADGFYYKTWINSITEAYYDQIQTQMMISEKDTCLLLVFVDKEDLKLNEFQADPARQQLIVEEVNKFAEIVKIGKQALKGMQNANESGNYDEYLAFNDIYESVTPEPTITAVEDNIDLIKELFEGSIDQDGNSKIGDVEDDKLMAYYLKCTKVMNSIKAHKDLAKVKLLMSCGEWGGIKTEDYKMVNRRAWGDKKAYFSVGLKK